MKKAVQILSYFLGGVMLLGSISLIVDGEMDPYTFLSFILVEAQVITTLIYVGEKSGMNKKK